MNPIGGYFELELNKGEEFHKNALKLNTGRNAFEYVILEKQYKKVWLPYYMCDVMLEPLNRNNLPYEFYSLHPTLYPAMDMVKLKMKMSWFYTNYFGLCDHHVDRIVYEGISTIIDNSLAFFSTPKFATDTFYSPLKFFGIPDGDYLYTNVSPSKKLDCDSSVDRFEHLIGRLEKGPEEFYQFFKKNDAQLSHQAIKRMSLSTQRLLGNIDYKGAIKRRTENFNYLHNKLAHLNLFPVLPDNQSTPMVYPLLMKNGGLLKEHQNKQKVYIPTYWPNVGAWIKSDNKVESGLFNDLVVLPIDQRYTSKEMDTILEIIENWL